MSLKNNLIKNGIGFTIQKGIRILEQLLLVPFFISAWGADYYGEWITLTIIPSILAFSDLGFGSAAANSFVLKYASGDKQGAANIGSSGFFVVTATVIAGLLITVLLLYGLNGFHVFDKLLIDKWDAIMALFMMMISKILSFYQQLFEAYYRAVRRAALSINLMSVYSGLNIVVGVTVLVLGGDVVAFAAANLVVSLMFYPVYILISRRVLSLEKECKGQIHKEDMQMIAKKGFGYLLSPIWQSVYYQGTTFVVRLTLGPGAVAIFNTVRTLSRTVNQIFNLVSSTAFPELQYEIGAKNMNMAKKIFNGTMGLNILFAIVGCIFLYFFGLDFYELWVKKVLSPPTAMWNVFLIGVLFNSIWWSAMYIFQAINKPYEFTVAGVVCAIISAGLCYPFSYVWGLQGAALAYITLDILLVLYVLPRACKVLDQSIKELLMNIIKDMTIFIKMLSAKMKIRR
ncbi:O-antigen/teichoic acid export membrane protein [Dysgonomonas sp. PFB1-18]|uniref:lipopolysaccharide biosynthesis protein n=1 Tax=unclassified Dysgonomonas TaxID=2630389 RepID=UPI0024730476|nr:MULTISPECIES: oligosaccharide flippase family protein [unclassified Dysgonomonas]MDH6308286.1 O-antigen/teichoic acid export membrane protein [Dysgonomonas sp. PF1-14]MDH6338276.1 O-antigen/teichoic acid export membrane protein [Dysgonomonas sp. PF1-16]MDH6379773.1 O-antigen/teichoic acid export membrane protein [Dysgonomonas sp. PFB1-18]MDH6397137.1 O-antigen/teichoic acid export membrane protein [Dysgonomonas sp. PF1-23]